MTIPCQASKEEGVTTISLSLSTISICTILEAPGNYRISMYKQLCLTSINVIITVTKGGYDMWKTIERKPNYEVNNLGQVRNKKTGRVLKNSTRKDGQMQLVIIWRLAIRAEFAINGNPSKLLTQ